MPHNSKKATKFVNIAFKDLYFFYISVINALRMCSKCFVYKWRVGDRPTEFSIILLKNFLKICENNYVRYRLKQLFPLVSVNSVFTSTLVNNCFLFSVSNGKFSLLVPISIIFFIMSFPFAPKQILASENQSELPNRSKNKFWGHVAPVMSQSCLHSLI